MVEAHAYGHAPLIRIFFGGQFKSLHDGPDVDLSALHRSPGEDDAI